MKPTQRVFRSEEEEIVDENAQQEEVAWMKAIANGNNHAFMLIMNKWKKPLINFFYRSVNCHATAEDLAQVTFIKLYRAAESYKPLARFSTFLFHIGRHVLLNEFRRVRRKPADLHANEDFSTIIRGEEDGKERELEEAFNFFVQELPENHRTAILLLKQQELSYKEIAEVMNASESAVKTWIYRARQDLKVKLSDFYENR